LDRETLEKKNGAEKERERGKFAKNKEQPIGIFGVIRVCA